jgi:ubiquinone/menaquinone biosynthesis C-methylase UbiE
MITAYSVLHHIYDYEYALREMARLLKTGGVLYIDHEHNDTYWTLLSQHLFKFYDLSNRVAHRIQTVPFRSRIAKLDYRSSDYRCKESARIEWARVNRMLCDYGFTTIATNYLSHGSSLTTPLNQLIRMARPEAKDMISLVCVKSGPSRIINQRRKSSEHN